MEPRKQEASKASSETTVTGAQILEIAAATAHSLKTTVTAAWQLDSAAAQTPLTGNQETFIG